MLPAALVSGTALFSGLREHAGLGPEVGVVDIPEPVCPDRGAVIGLDEKSARTRRPGVPFDARPGLGKVGRRWSE